MFQRERKVLDGPAFVIVLDGCIGFLAGDRAEGETESPIRLGYAGQVGSPVGRSASRIRNLEISAPQSPPITFFCEGIDYSGLSILHETDLVAFYGIEAPFPDVAMHVVQAEGVCFLLLDRMSFPEGVLGKPAELVEMFGIVRNGGWNAIGRAHAKRPGRAGPAGIFPFRLGGESPLVTGRRLLRFVELFAKGLGIEPGNLDGQVRFLAGAWVFPHDFLELLLGNL